MRILVWRKIVNVALWDRKTTNRAVYLILFYLLLITRKGGN